MRIASHRCSVRRESGEREAGGTLETKKELRNEEWERGEPQPHPHPHQILGLARRTRSTGQCPWARDRLLPELEDGEQDPTRKLCSGRFCPPEIRSLNHRVPVSMSMSTGSARCSVTGALKPKLQRRRGRGRGRGEARSHRRRHPSQAGIITSGLLLEDCNYTESRQLGQAQDPSRHCVLSAESSDQ